jgi:hypothetical protein
MSFKILVKHAKRSFAEVTAEGCEKKISTQKNHQNRL